MFYVLLITMMLVVLVYLIFYIISYKIKYSMESISSYECGFEPNSFTRMVFSYRFFLISILFIIFDVELSLMLPVPFLSDSMIGLWVFYVFVLVLILGLIYEYFCGSLDWLEMKLQT